MTKGKGKIMETLLQDLRYSLRMLRKNLGFTIIAVFTLALGIGANTAIFSVVDNVLLRPLPFKEPDRLVSIWENNPQKGEYRSPTGPANYLDWKSQSGVFEEMAAYMTWTYNLTGVDDPERIESAVVSGSFFQALGVEAASGRVLLPDDDRPGSDNVVVLSHGLWQRRFGGDQNIIGQKITLNRNSFIVVGVMNADFRFPHKEVELWVPFGFAPKQYEDRVSKFISVVARLKPSVELEQAKAEMATIAARLEQQYPEANTGWSVGVVSLQEDEVRAVKSPLLILLGAVGFVLLIACVNVANLLLVRVAKKQKELAIRAALGAGRLRLLSQLLSESLVLALLGGMFGMLLALWGVEILPMLAPGDIPRLDRVAMDMRIFGFTLGVSFVTALIFGLAPALSASKPDIQTMLKEESAGSTRGSGIRPRNLLIVAEVAIALVLLVGAGLMMKSFLRLQAVDPGFNSANVLTMRVWLPASKYATNQQQIAFFQQVVDRIEAVPGVESVGAIQDLPLRLNKMTYALAIEGRPPSSPGEKTEAAYRVVTPDYFNTLGIAVLGGRQFTREDNLNSPPVLIINQSMAKRYWPGEDPVGKRLRFLEDESLWYTVVGVVADIKHMGLDAEEGAAVYQPHAQKSFTFLRWMTLVARTSAEPTGFIAGIRNQVLALDRDQPVYDIVTVEQLLSQSVAKPRFMMLLLALFAATALILVVIGVYGVIAHTVSERTREIGIRMALGARAADVVKMVLGQAMAFIVMGVAAGLVGALCLTRIMTGLLYDVTATDPITYLGVSLLLVIIALAACYIPARRAAKVDPIIALR